MSFVYYIPGARQNEVKKRAKSMLPDVLEFDADGKKDSDVQIFANETARGPDDGQGGLIHQGQGVPFDLEQQKWTKHPNEPYWVGFNEDDPPGPDDLERQETVGRYSAPLGDGNKWMIPTAAGYENDYCPLPKSRKIDAETGDIQRRPLKKYDRLRMYADEVRQATLDDNADQINLERETEILMCALSTNYRITLLEASLLDLLTDEAAKWIVWLLVNRLEWPDAQKMMAEMKEGEDT